MCQAMISRDKSMNSAFFSSIVTMDETWMPLFNPETKRQTAQWKHTDSLPPKKFGVSASAEKMKVAMFWDSEGMILTHCVPKSTTVTGQTYEDVLWTKFLPALREKGPKRLQLCSFITTTLLLIGRLVYTQQLRSCSSCSILTWPRTKRFLAVSNTEGHSSWSHIFKSFRSCNSNFPTVTTNP